MNCPDCQPFFFFFFIAFQRLHESVNVFAHYLNNDMLDLVVLVVMKGVSIVRFFNLLK